MLISPNRVHFLDLKCFLAFLPLVQDSTPAACLWVPEYVRTERYLYRVFRFFPHGSIQSLFLWIWLSGTCIRLLIILGSTTVQDPLWPPEPSLSCSCLPHQSPLALCTPSFSSLASFQVVPGQYPKLPKSFWILGLSLRHKLHSLVLVFRQRIALALYWCILVTNGDMGGVYLPFRPPGPWREKTPLGSSPKPFSA